MDFRIPTSTVRFVPLSQLVSVDYGLEEGIIWRRDLYPTITVRAHIRGKIQAPVVMARIAELLDCVRVRLPAGYRIEVGGLVSRKAARTVSRLSELVLRCGPRVCGAGLSA